MAISNNYVPLKQLGNGVTTAFSASWAVLNSAYIRVYLQSVLTGAQVLQNLGSDYTLVFSSTGFTVTFNTAPTSANYVVVGRQTSEDQTVPYTTSKGFQGAVIEDSLDKLTAMIQDLSDGVGRSLKFQLGSSAIGFLPDPVDSEVLAWSGTSGQLQNGPTIGAIANAAANAAIAQAAAATAVQAAANVTSIFCGTATGTVNAIAISPSPAITSYAAGQRFQFVSSGANTGAVTVSASGLSPQALTKFGGLPLIANDIPAGGIIDIQYDGTRFQLQDDGLAAYAKLDGSTLTNTTIVGSTTAAPAGAVGEYQEAEILSGSAVSLPSNTPVTILNLPLTAGEWDVEASIIFVLSGGSSTVIQGSINTTAGTLVTAGKPGYAFFTNPGTNNQQLNLLRTRISLASSGNAYLVAQSNLASGSNSGYGWISARRVH